MLSGDVCASAGVETGGMWPGEFFGKGCVSAGAEGEGKTGPKNKN